MAACKPGWRLTANGPNNNLEGDFPGLYKFECYDVKLDHQFSTAHKILGRYSLVRHRSEERPVRGLTDALQFGNTYVRPLDFHNYVVSDTYTFSPTAINEMRRVQPSGIYGGSSDIWPGLGEATRHPERQPRYVPRFPELRRCALLWLRSGGTIVYAR